MGNKPSIFSTQTISFSFLELYVFLYSTLNQQYADFRSFLFALPFRRTEISHSHYA